MNGDNELTKKQARILKFIQKESRMTGPSVREIGAHFGIASPNGVVCHLKALERKGVIRRRRRRARGIEVVA